MALKLFIKTMAFHQLKQARHKNLHLDWIPACAGMTDFEIVT